MDALAAANRQIRFILILGGLGAFAPMSIDMYLPALPQLAHDLHTSASDVELTLTACLVGLACGQLIAGPLSDRFGRRRPLFVGLIAYAAASIACALAPSILALIGLRLAQALAAAAGIVISRAAVRDLHSGVALAKFFSLLMLVNGLAPVLAPVLGGQILRFTSWRGMFFVLAAIGLFLLAASVLFLPETLPPEDRTDRAGLRVTLRAFSQLAIDRQFAGYALVGGLSFAALFAYISSSSFVLQSIFGLSPQQFSAVFAMNSVGLILGGQLSARLLRRFTPRRLLTCGSILMTVSSLVLFADAVIGLGLPGILPPLFLAVASTGLLMPNSTALALTGGQHMAGAASALLGFGQFLIGGAVAPLVSLSGARSAVPMATAILVLATASLLTLATVTRPSKEVPVAATADLSAAGEAR